MRASSEEMVAALNERLWTYDDASFLPHGAAGDGDPMEQPIFLTSELDNPNAATMLVQLSGADSERGDDAFDLVVLMFDGRDEAALAQAWANGGGSQGCARSAIGAERRGRLGRRGSLDCLGPCGFGASFLVSGIDFLNSLDLFVRNEDLSMGYAIFAVNFLLFSPALAGGDANSDLEARRRAVHLRFNAISDF